MTIALLSYVSACIAALAAFGTPHQLGGGIILAVFLLTLMASLRLGLMPTEVADQQPRALTPQNQKPRTCRQFCSTAPIDWRPGKLRLGATAAEAKSP